MKNAQASGGVGKREAIKNLAPLVAANMCEFLKFPMERGVRICRGMALRPNKRLKKRKRLRKLKINPLGRGLGMPRLLAAPRRENPLQDCSFRTLINTFNPVDTDAEARGSNQALQSDGHVEEEAVDVFNNNENNNKEVNYPHSITSPHSKYSSHLEHSLHSKEHTDIRTLDDEGHLNERDDNV
nr:hypothetical protein [Tanacetum cinerariifolium]